ncbi:MAG: amino acid ABC transporter permease [Candidatus Thorarchaeota archaeon]
MRGALWASRGREDIRIDGGIQLTTITSSSIGALQWWERIAPYYDDLFNGFMMTMGLYIFAILLGLIIGILVAIARHYGGPLISRIATAFVEFLRGTPLLAQILLVVYVPPVINAFLESQGFAPIDTSWAIVLPDLWGNPQRILDLRILLCAIMLGLNSAAYQAEFFRGAMGSIASGQSLAAISIGMTKRQEIRHVMLPQSLRRAIPAWTNEAVYLPKYTTVVYYVAVQEIFLVSKLIVSRTYEVLPVYAILAVVFLALISAISWMMNALYKRIKIPGI